MTEHNLDDYAPLAVFFVLTFVLAPVVLVLA